MNTRARVASTTALVSALLLLLTACIPLPRPPERTPPPTSEQPAPDSSTGGPGGTDAELEQLQKDTDSAVNAVDTFWSDHWSDFFTGTYDGPRVYGYYNGEDGPTCGGQPPEVENAFFCPAENYVAWDVNLMRKAGPQANAWVYLIVAHEWGHAIQSEVPSAASGDPELQADCFAGATLYGSAADGVIVFEPQDEKVITLSLTELADQTAWTQSSDHGDTFQRIEAFDQGRKGGVEACIPDGS